MKTAVLTYSTPNLGDDLQSMAVTRLLPGSPALLDRDHLARDVEQLDEPTLLIGTGWWMYGREVVRRAWNLKKRRELAFPFPPPEKLRVFFIGVHFLKFMGPFLKRHRRYLKTQEPIGCRDKATLKLLQGLGVEAFYSGCVSLTLPAASAPRSRQIVLADIQQPAKGSKADPISKLIPADVRAEAREVTHQLDPGEVSRLTPRGRSERVAELLDLYSQARLVITSRVHAALPCLALGTPVIFVHPNPADPRLEAVARFLPVYGPDTQELPLGWTEAQRPQTSIARETGDATAELIREAAVCGCNPLRKGYPLPSVLRNITRECEEGEVLSSE